MWWFFSPTWQGKEGSQNDRWLNALITCADGIIWWFSWVNKFERWLGQEAARWWFRSCPLGGHNCLPPRPYIQLTWQPVKCHVRCFRHLIGMCDCVMTTTASCQRFVLPNTHTHTHLSSCAVLLRESAAAACVRPRGDSTFALDRLWPRVGNAKCLKSYIGPK